MAEVQLRLGITWTPGRGGGRILSQRAPTGAPASPALLCAPCSCPAHQVGWGSRWVPEARVSGSCQSQQLNRTQVLAS